MDINKHKFHGNYKLSGYESEKIIVNNTEYKHSIVVSNNTFVTNWEPQQAKKITSNDIELLITLDPEIIIIGTGMKHHFIDEAILEVAFNKNIPVEMMSSSKACMLYTILIQEQKYVVAAIMP